MLLHIYCNRTYGCVIKCRLIIKAPHYQGRLFVFVRFRPPAAVAAASVHGLSIPCHPDIYKSAFCIHLVLNILDTSINS